MAQAGAAIHLPEVALAERLQAEVQRLLADAALRAAMAEAARRLARPHAARAIATEVLRWAEMRRAHPARRHHD
jgi:UDP-N-acetylglucosamine--N-acetylmuramyl-(pentapeptide) pyrophosphoryl-undecaprenol N-acetylglucosamine transferase